MRAFIPDRSGFRIVKVARIAMRIPWKNIASFEAFPAYYPVRIG
jgi:hypothetical protein